MEIITYVRSGAITHKDSMGNTGRTGAGDVQVMSAGTGIRHSEYNLRRKGADENIGIWIKAYGATAETRAGGAKPFPKAGRSRPVRQFLPAGFEDDEGATPIGPTRGFWGRL